jgi:hypothetical protein
VAQEFFINSQELENKVQKLLPSQGGAGAGFDLSASTQIVPIIDLTETAEGGNERADIQSAFSLKTITTFNVVNSATTIINTTGTFRVFGGMTSFGTSDSSSCNISLTDGTTTKSIIDGRLSIIYTAVGLSIPLLFDFLVRLEAGDSLVATSTASTIGLRGNTRQIAALDGTLTNP